MIRARSFLLLALAALGLSACGSAPLSLVQLRTRASAICRRANRRMQAIPPPTGGSGAKTFLDHGAAALAPEVDQLGGLSGSGDAGSVYRAAVSATSNQLAALRAASHALGAGQQPVPVLASLQRRLTPLETQADDAWRSLQIPSCLTR